MDDGQRKLSSFGPIEEKVLYNKSLFIERNCARIGDSNTYLIKGDITFEDTKSCIRKIEVGKRDIQKPEKVILMVGETGSGKTTFINQMLNHVVGVECSSNYRVKLIEELETCSNQAKSQTNCVTAYTINNVPGFEIPFTLTVIDTPGYAATQGIERDIQTTEQLQTLFTTKGPKGIDHLDAVGFVSHSSKPRLTSTQKYIYDCILSLFGKDMGDNIIMLFTHLDGSKPTTLFGLEEAKIPFKTYFTFNNIDIFDSNMTKLKQIFWEKGITSFQSVMMELNTIQPKTLILTREVLYERERLENVLVHIERNIHLNTDTLEQLRREDSTLKPYREELERNKKHIYEALEQYAEREITRSGYIAINCSKCNVTCCQLPSSGRDLTTVNVAELIQVPCTSCPSKCLTTEHKIEKYQYVFKNRLVYQTHEDIQRKYERAKGKKMNAEQLLQECASKIMEVREETQQFIKETRRCINRLTEIALKPNPLESMEDYIDLLIENETRHGSHSTMMTLLQFQEQIKQRKAILDEKSDPFENINMVHFVEIEKNHKGEIIRTVIKAYKTQPIEHQEGKDFTQREADDV